MYFIVCWMTSASIQTFKISAAKRLFIACNQSIFHLVKFFLRQRGANIDINIPGELGATPLMVVSRTSGATPHRRDQVTSTVESLLAAPNIDVNAVDKYGRTALWWAASEGQPDVVQILLSNTHVDINYRNVDGQTALFAAVLTG